MRKGRDKGFSLMELLIVVGIMSTVFAGGYVILATGQSTWFTTDISIQLQENLRRAVERAGVELNQTKLSEVEITDGGGVNNTDVIKFSIPITCHAGDPLLSATGDVNHWGAPLTWGCTSAGCMDENDDCSELEYRFIEYRISNNRLVRRVLSSLSTLVREDVVGDYISNFQITSNGSLLQLSITAQKTTVGNQVLTALAQNNVYLRN